MAERGKQIFPEDREMLQVKGERRRRALLEVWALKLIFCKKSDQLEGSVKKQRTTAFTNLRKAALWVTLLGPPIYAGLCIYIQEMSTLFIYHLLSMASFFKSIWTRTRERNHPCILLRTTTQINK
uniref:Uncharacterized protein n=1 Tax=Myotis myotis TaxID=51298 RepID=A0A7J8AN28_MYOMY|nr:hypothetical protein mMyoMyo1_008100 [Myotis myotis]